MPTQTEIAKRWDLSKMRVCQLVKEGMPTATFRAADRWRANRGLRREPTNGKSKQDASPGTQSAAKESLAVQDCDIGNLSEKEIQARIAMLNLSAPTGDSLQDALNTSIFVAELAFNEYLDACASGSVNQAARLSDHTKAVRAMVKVDAMCGEEQERRKTLVNKNAVLQTTKVSIEAMMIRLSRVPKEVGPQCNPGNPPQATRVLEREVALILTEGAKAVRDLLASRTLEGPRDAHTREA